MKFLEKTDPYAKTIVFCRTINHAERLRQALVNLAPEKVRENSRYIMRITGDDEIGKAQLDNFIDPESKYPVIATTSKLMTTGVDAQTCKVIVLDNNINSMTEFKQVIGRGTRVREDYGKTYFTILDFRNVTKLFADPEFDGDPVKVFEINQDVEPEEAINEVIADDAMFDEVQDHSSEVNDSGIANAYMPEPSYDKLPTQIVHTISGQSVEIIGDKVSILDADGKLIRTESESERKQKVEKLRAQNLFSGHTDFQKQLIDELLEKYIESDIATITNPEVLKVAPFLNFGTPMEIINKFGGREAYDEVITKIKNGLYD